MKIVIDVPECFYEYCKAQPDATEIQLVVKNGVPLPKGHGRLIDADEAIKILKSLGNRDYRRNKGTIQDAEKMLSYDGYTPTIIKADEEK